MDGFLLELLFLCFCFKYNMLYSSLFWCMKNVVVFSKKDNCFLGKI